MEYSIEGLVGDCHGKTFPDLLIYLSREVDRLRLLSAQERRSAKTRYQRRSSDIYAIEQRLQHAVDFQYFLLHGAVPAGIGIAGVRLFTDVVARLVSDGGLRKDYMRILLPPDESR